MDTWLQKNQTFCCVPEHPRQKSKCTLPLKVPQVNHNLLVQTSSGKSHWILSNQLVVASNEKNHSVFQVPWSNWRFHPTLIAKHAEVKQTFLKYRAFDRSDKISSKMANDKCFCLCSMIWVVSQHFYHYRYLTHSAGQFIEFQQNLSFHKNFQLPFK